MKNYSQTLLAQFANSPTISALVAFMDQWVSPHADLDNFYNTVWNIQTASGFGLDTWGQIVNVSRVVQIPTGGTFLGFQGTGEQPLGQAPMFNGNNNSGNFNGNGNIGNNFGNNNSTSGNGNNNGHTVTIPKLPKPPKITLPTLKWTY